MENHTEADKETHLLHMVSNWGELKTRSLNQDNLKSVTTILVHMSEMHSYGLMRQFVETLEDKFVSELTRCPQTFFCLAKMKLHFNQFTAVYDMIKNVGAEIQGEGQALIQLWNATLYKEAEMVRGKQLNSLKKFRLRSRKPPPVHICPNGERPTNSLPEHATITLWRWALQHAYRLYPTKDDRLHLEQTAGLTAYQVKTWFANVRRRVKKCGIRTVLEKKKAKYGITEDIIFKEPPRRASEQPHYLPVTPVDLVKGSKAQTDSLLRPDGCPRSLHAATPNLLSCTTPIWDACPFNVDRKIQATCGTVPEAIANPSKRYPSAPSQHADTSSAFLPSYNQPSNDRPASQHSSMFSTETPAPAFSGLTNVYHPTSDHYSCGVEELTSTFVRNVTPPPSEQLVPSTEPYTTLRRQPYPPYDICKWPGMLGGTTDKSTFPDLPQCVPDRTLHVLNTPTYVPDYHPISHVNLNHSSYTPLEVYPMGPCYTTQTYKNPFPLPTMSRDPLATLLGSETPTYCLPSYSSDVYPGYYQSIPRPHGYSMNSLCTSFGCSLSHSFSSSSNLNQNNPSSSFLNLSHASSTLSGFAEPLSRPVSRAMCMTKQSLEKKTRVTSRVASSWSCEGEGRTREGLGCPPLVQPQPSLTKRWETRADLYGASVTAGGEVEGPVTLKSSPDYSVASVPRPGQYDMLRYMLQDGLSQYRPPYTSTHHTNTISSGNTNSRVQPMETSHYTSTLHVNNPTSSSNTTSSNSNITTITTSNITTITNSRVHPIQTSHMSYIDNRKSHLNYPKPPTARKMTRVRRRQNQNRAHCTSGGTSNGGNKEVITSSPGTHNGLPTTTTTTTTGRSSHPTVEVVGVVSAGELLMSYTGEQLTHNTSSTSSSSIQVGPSLSGYLQNPERLTSSVKEQLIQGTLLNEQFLQHPQTLATREQQPPQRLTSSVKEQFIQGTLLNEQFLQHPQTLATREQQPSQRLTSVKEQVIQGTLLNEQFLHSQTLATREQQPPQRLTSSVKEQLIQGTLLNEQFLQHPQTLATREQQQPLQTATGKELLQTLCIQGREQLTQSPVHNEQLMDTSHTLTTPTRELLPHLHTPREAPPRELLPHPQTLPHPPAEVLFSSNSHCGRQVSERGGILHLSPEMTRRAEPSAVKTARCSTGPQQRVATRCSADRPPPPAATLWPGALNKDSISGRSVSGHSSTSTAPPHVGSLWPAAPLSPRLPTKAPCAVVSGGEMPGGAASRWPCAPSTGLPLLPPTPQWTPASPPAIVSTYNPAKANRTASDTRGAVPSYPNLHLARPPYPTPRRDSLGSSPRSSLTSEPASPYTQPDEQDVVEALLHLSNYSMPSLPETTYYNTGGPQYNT